MIATIGIFVGLKKRGIIINYVGIYRDYYGFIPRIGSFSCFLQMNPTIFYIQKTDIYIYIYYYYYYY